MRRPSNVTTSRPRSSCWPAGLAASLAVYKGAPQAATQHHDFAFFLGIVGAVMTVVCALALGAILSGSL